MPGPDSRPDTVPDGVFDERLQQKVWHQALEGVVGDLEAHREPLTEPRLFDCHVLT